MKMETRDLTVIVRVNGQTVEAAFELAALDE